MERVETSDPSQQQAADDTVASIKQSCYRYQGNLTRRYHELERLMVSYENFQTVKENIQKIEEVFGLYEAKHKQLADRTQGPELERLQSEYETAIRNKSELLKRAEEWFEGYEKTQNISKDGDNKSVHSFSSNRSSNCSTSSQKLKEARVKHELANLKMKQVKEKLELEQKQRQFAEDLLLLDAKNELECSELETSFWANEVEMEGEMLDEVHVSNVGPKVKVEDESPSHADRGKEVHSGKVENKIEVNAKKPPQVNTYPLNPNAREWQGAYIPDPWENGGADPFQLCNMLNLLTSIPKPELQKFDWGAH
ncbi:hypothetical protein HOLleu_29593 [Holothuria leucospilota]|uniref:Uncharacterized protein n=1 Tax=Holothuria leucospilota TaxID=206669 RepID=A0A9Q1BNS8_HOLLE|nr:hypothetical protein HOLleu_29593 [Holothuria leucospilota]